MCILLLPISMERLQLLLSKCDEVCIAKSDLAASKEQELRPEQEVGARRSVEALARGVDRILKREQS